MICEACGAEALEIDVRCGACGAVLGATGAHRMLGQVMLGQYELVDVLGQGGMSVVFKGKHKLTNQEVALKILPPELAANKEVKSRFLDEARALAALDHGNIVHLYNFGQENGFFVLAMQYVQGRTWERMILESTRLPWSVSCRIAVDVLRALEYAHGRGVVHRDMKPSNVLVRASDAAATVMDFGIAKMTTSTRLTATGQTMGTVRYMSPEQVRGQDVDLRTDIYSLGATLYESLVGETPFDGTTHFEIMTKHLSELPTRPSVRGIELPLIVEDALMRSLAKRPEDRFENAREMRKLLEQAMRLADISLTETQPLGRDVLEQVPGRSGPIAATLPPVAPAPTTAATGLADVLEPGSSLPGARRRRSPWPWVALGLLVTGGGITAALMLTGREAAPVQIADTVMREQRQYGDLRVMTDGGVPADEIDRLYRAAWSDLQAHFAAQQPPFQITQRVREIVALPQQGLCSPQAYLLGGPPRDCMSIASTITMSPRNVPRMYVVSDPAQLRQAIRRGVAQAICDFDSVAAAAPTEICDEADRFAR